MLGLALRSVLGLALRSMSPKGVSDCPAADVWVVSTPASVPLRGGTKVVVVPLVVGSGAFWISSSTELKSVSHLCLFTFAFANLYGIHWNDTATTVGLAKYFEGNVTWSENYGGG